MIWMIDSDLHWDLVILDLLDRSKAVDPETKTPVEKRLPEESAPRLCIDMM